MTGPWLPLTAAQRGLFFAHQLAPDNPCYTTAEVVELDGPVDRDLLAQALEQAYAEFEQLRVVLRLTSAGPAQRVVDRGPSLQQVAVGSEAEAEEWLRADLARPMDLLGGDCVRTALLSLPDGASWWYHAAHHVILDGYGAQQLFKRVAELYAGAPTRTSASLETLLAEEPSDPDGAAFWEERLADLHGGASLAGRAEGPAPAAVRRSLVLTAEQQTAIARGARRLGVGWPDLITAAVGGYVARMAGLSSVRVGLPLMNRTLPGVGALASARTVCTAMNVLPATVPAAGTVAEALTSVAAEQAAHRRHPFTRQEELARVLRRLDPGAQLFGAQVNIIPFELEVELAPADGPSAVGRVRNLTAGPVEDLTVCLRGAPGRGRTVRLEIDANPRLYPADEIDLHLSRLAAWLETYAAAAPDAEVASLPLLTERERTLVVEGFNDTTVARDSATLGERFVAQAERTPAAEAIVFAGRSRSYGQLLAAASRVAAGLAAAGVGPGDVVGVALERSFELYEVVHGIALLGAVYLPLDPDLPDERIAGMLEDAAAVAVIEPGSIPDADPVVPLPVVDADGPAYVLFTSGSTGRPKGVLVGHRAIDNRLAWMQDHLPLSAGDRVLHKTPISFDVSIWELFWPLQVGAAVVIAEPGAHRDPRAIADAIVADGVSTLHFVPSMLRAFLADPKARARVGDSVRHVVTSGEALTPDLVSGSAEVFGVHPTNLYGPTEAAVDVTCWDTSADDDTVPIGRPVWNTSCLVLDAEMRPVPVGVVGELWLGGVQLADGYVGRPDLTAERFVETALGRLYRTGDLAAWRVDGALRYLGRTDDQVKIRGQRVELGEIEAAVAGLPVVSGVAAGVVQERLVLWYVPSSETGTDAASAEVALRAAAGARLPESWLPHHWVAVTEIPLGTSGKTDRRRLAEIAPPTADAEITDGPHGLVEQRLCAVFADVLDLEAVGPSADFFGLGGDSLRVLRLITAVEDDLGVELSLGDVFARPTPAGLATVVAAGGSPTETGEILTLRAGGERTPLFLLPPAGGLGWCYTGLLRSLPSDLPVHTIQAPGLADGAPEPVADLAALARRQLAAIRAIVGEGAFHVAGWSLGGMAAQAVAAAARAEGQEVGAVVLLDAYPSDQWQHLAEPTEQDALVGVLRLGGLDAPAGPLDRATAIRLLKESGSAVGELSSQVIEGVLASVVEAARIVRTSAHAVLPGDLTVVVATAPRAESWLDATGWKAYVEGEVRTVEIAATHGELVRRPRVDEVGAVLADLLDG